MYHLLNKYVIEVHCYGYSFQIFLTLSINKVLNALNVESVGNKKVIICELVNSAGKFFISFSLGDFGIKSRMRGTI